MNTTVEDFVVEKDTHATFIRCNAPLNRAGYGAIMGILVDLTYGLGPTESPRIVMDLKKKFEFDEEFLTRVTRVTAVLEKFNQSLYAINVPQSSLDLIKEKGLSRVLIGYPSAEEIFGLTEADATGMTFPELDGNFINAFIEGTINTLKIQCDFDVTAGQTYTKGGPDTIGETEIAALIGVAGKDLKGTVTIAFPKNVFLRIIGKMLGENFREITDDLADGASELLNIIFGQAKKVLNEKGYAIQSAIPTLIRGKSLSITALTHRAALVLPFDTDAGTFRFEIVTSGVRSRKRSFPSDTRIIVIDDMITMRKAIRKSLLELGYTSVTEAPDGHAAWDGIHGALSTHKPFQLIICDWNMPEMNGLDLLERVRTTPETRAIPFILLTGEADKDKVMKAVKAGVSSYMVKPFTTETLDEKMKIAWDHSQTR